VAGHAGGKKGVNPTKKGANPTKRGEQPDVAGHVVARNTHSKDADPSIHVR
jgi:hypothetical protein